MLENFAYDRKKRLLLPKHYAQPSVKLPKFFNLSSLGGCHKWMTSVYMFIWKSLSLYVYVKKWIIVVIVNKLILVYFTWLIQNFVNHNRNVLLKRNNVWLMPLNIFVYVFHVHSPKRLHLSGKVGTSRNISKMSFWNGLFLCEVLLSYPHIRIRVCHELTRVSLAC